MCTSYDINDKRAGFQDQIGKPRSHSKIENLDMVSKQRQCHSGVFDKMLYHHLWFSHSHRLLGVSGSLFWPTKIILHSPRSGKNGGVETVI